MEKRARATHDKGEVSVFSFGAARLPHVRMRPQQQQQQQQQQQCVVCMESGVLCIGQISVGRFGGFFIAGANKAARMKAASDHRACMVAAIRDACG